MSVCVEGRDGLRLEGILEDKEAAEGEVRLEASTLGSADLDARGREEEEGGGR